MRVRNMRLYPAASDTVAGHLAAKLDGHADRYWEQFYRRNADRFFKDRHYFDREFPELVSGPHVVLEVGCGVGNTVFPLLDLNPQITAYACDFSATAVDLVKKHPGYASGRCTAFVADITRYDLTATVSAGGVDACTMIFVLSAVSPDAMPAALRNVAATLRPGTGRVLFRDYASGDLAQSRLATSGSKKLSERFYARGDGTRCYYFEPAELVGMFAAQGFVCESLVTHERDIENRKTEVHMHRRWLQAVFRFDPPAAAAAAAGVAGGSTANAASVGSSTTGQEVACETYAAKNGACGTVRRQLAVPAALQLQDNSTAVQSSSTGDAFDESDADANPSGSGSDEQPGDGRPGLVTFSLSGAAGRLAAQRGAMPGVASGRAQLPDTLDSPDEQYASVRSPGERSAARQIEADLERLFFETVSQDTSAVVATETSGRRTIQLAGLESGDVPAQPGAQSAAPGGASARALPAPGAAPSAAGGAERGKGNGVDDDEDAGNHEAPLYSYQLGGRVAFECCCPPGPSGRQPVSSAAVSPLVRQLAAYLVAHPELCVMKRVVELGAGPSGLCSLAAVRSARLVCAAEADPQRLELLADTLDLNACRVVWERLRCISAGTGDVAALRAAVGQQGADVVLLARAPWHEIGAHCSAAAQLLAHGGALLVACEGAAGEADAVRAAATAAGLQLVASTPLEPLEGSLGESSDQARVLQLQAPPFADS